MGDVELSCNQKLDANLACEQPSDHILGQLALATIMLALEVELLAFVRALNAADAHSAAIEQAADGPFIRLLRRVAAMNIRTPRRSPHHQLQHSPA
jgi:hypothetical protein